MRCRTIIELPAPYVFNTSEHCDPQLEDFNLYYPALVTALLLEAKSNYPELINGHSREASLGIQKACIKISALKLKGPDYHFEIKRYYPDHPGTILEAQSCGIEINAAQLQEIESLTPDKIRQDDTNEESSSNSARAENTDIPLRNRPRANGISPHYILGHKVENQAYEAKLADSFLLQPLRAAAETERHKHYLINDYLNELENLTSNYDRYHFIEEKICYLERRFLSRQRFGRLINTLREIQTEYANHSYTVEQFKLLSAVNNYSKHRILPFKRRSQRKQQRVEPLKRILKNNIDGNISDLYTYKALAYEYKKIKSKSLRKRFESSLLAFQTKNRELLTRGFEYGCNEADLYFSPFYQYEIMDAADLEILFGKEIKSKSLASFLDSIKHFMSRTPLESKNLSSYIEVSHHLFSGVNVERGYSEQVTKLKHEASLLADSKYILDTLTEGIESIERNIDQHLLSSASKYLANKISLHNGHYSPLRKVADWLSIHLSSVQTNDESGVMSDCFGMMLDSGLIHTVLAHCDVKRSQERLSTQLLKNAESWIQENTQFAYSRFTKLKQIIEPLTSNPEQKMTACRRLTYTMLAENGDIAELTALASSSSNRSDLSNGLKRQAIENYLPRLCDRKSYQEEREHIATAMINGHNTYVSKHMPDILIKDIAAENITQIVKIITIYLCEALQNVGIKNCIPLFKNVKLLQFIKQYLDPNGEIYAEFKQTLSQAIGERIECLLKANKLHKIGKLYAAPNSVTYQLFISVFRKSDLSEIINERLYKYISKDPDLTDFYRLSYTPWRLHHAGIESSDAKDNQIKRWQYLYAEKKPEFYNGLHLSVTNFCQNGTKEFLGQITAEKAFRCAVSLTQEQISALFNQLTIALDYQGLLNEEQHDLLTNFSDLNFQTFASINLLMHEVPRALEDVSCHELSRYSPASLSEFTKHGVKLFLDSITQIHDAISPRFTTQTNNFITDDFDNRDINAFAVQHKHLTRLFNIDCTEIDVASIKHSLSELKFVSQDDPIIELELRSTWESLRFQIYHYITQHENDELKPSIVDDLLEVITSYPEDYEYRNLLLKLLSNNSMRGFSNIPLNKYEAFISAINNNQNAMIFTDDLLDILRPSSIKIINPLLSGDIRKQFIQKLKVSAEKLQKQKSSKLLLALLQSIINHLTDGDEYLPDNIIQKHNKLETAGDIRTQLILGSSNCRVCAVDSWLTLFEKTYNQIHTNTLAHSIPYALDNIGITSKVERNKIKITKSQRRKLRQFVLQLIDCEFGHYDYAMQIAKVFKLRMPAKKLIKRQIKSIPTYEKNTKNRPIEEISSMQHIPIKNIDRTLLTDVIQSRRHANELTHGLIKLLNHKKRCIIETATSITNFLDYHKSPGADKNLIEADIKLLYQLAKLNSSFIELFEDNYIQQCGKVAGKMTITAPPLLLLVKHVELARYFKNRSDITISNDIEHLHIAQPSELALAQSHIIEYLHEIILLLANGNYDAVIIEPSITWLCALCMAFSDCENLTEIHNLAEIIRHHALEQIAQMPIHESPRLKKLRQLTQLTHGIYQTYTLKKLPESAHDLRNFARTEISTEHPVKTLTIMAQTILFNTIDLNIRHIETALPKRQSKQFKSFNQFLISLKNRAFSDEQEMQEALITSIPIHNKLPVRRQSKKLTSLKQSLSFVYALQSLLQQLTCLAQSLDLQKLQRQYISRIASQIDQHPIFHAQTKAQAKRIKHIKASTKILRDLSLCYQDIFNKEDKLSTNTIFSVKAHDLLDKLEHTDNHSPEALNVIASNVVYLNSSFSYLDNQTIDEIVKKMESKIDQVIQQYLSNDLSSYPMLHTFFVNPSLRSGLRSDSPVTAQLENCVFSHELYSFIKTIFTDLHQAKNVISIDYDHPIPRKFLLPEQLDHKLADLREALYQFTKNPTVAHGIIKPSLDALFVLQHHWYNSSQDEQVAQLQSVKDTVKQYNLLRRLQLCIKAYADKPNSFYLPNDLINYLKEPRDYSAELVESLSISYRKLIQSLDILEDDKFISTLYANRENLMLAFHHLQSPELNAELERLHYDLEYKKIKPLALNLKLDKTQAKSSSFHEAIMTFSNISDETLFTLINQTSPHIRAEFKKHLESALNSLKQIFTFLIYGEVSYADNFAIEPVTEGLIQQLYAKAHPRQEHQSFIPSMMDASLMNAREILSSTTVLQSNESRAVKNTFYMLDRFGSAQQLAELYALYFNFLSQASISISRSNTNTIAAKRLQPTLNRVTLLLKCFNLPRQYDAQKRLITNPAIYHSARLYLNNLQLISKNLSIKNNDELVTQFSYIKKFLDKNPKLDTNNHCLNIMQKLAQNDVETDSHSM